MLLSEFIKQNLETLNKKVEGRVYVIMKEDDVYSLNSVPEDSESLHDTDVSLVWRPECIEDDIEFYIQVIEYFEESEEDADINEFLANVSQSFWEEFNIESDVLLTELGGLSELLEFWDNFDPDKFSYDVITVIRGSFTDDWEEPTPLGNYLKNDLVNFIDEQIEAIKDDSIQSYMDKNKWDYIKSTYRGNSTTIQEVHCNAIEVELENGTYVLWRN